MARRREAEAKQRGAAAATATAAAAARRREVQRSAAGRRQLGTASPEAQRARLRSRRRGGAQAADEAWERRGNVEVCKFTTERRDCDFELF